MTDPIFITFVDGGCYTRPDKTTTRGYFSFQVWDNITLQQFYRGKQHFYTGTRKVFPQLSMERFYLRSLIASKWQKDHVFFDKLRKSHDIRPDPQLFLPDHCSIFDATGKETNNIAEYAALYYALRAIINNLPFGQKIEIYSDSQLIINQVTDQWRCTKPHLQVWQQATKKLILDNKFDLDLKHVGRDTIEKMLGH